jgi:hypothetical protein
MKLTEAYLLLTIVLALAGWLFFKASPWLQSFRRDRWMTVIFLSAVIVWLTWHLWHLSEADILGLPRSWVMALILIPCLLSYYFMPDFLAVRCLGALMLFTARAVLDAGYGHLPHSLWAASVSYGILVLFGLWWAASPVAFNQHCDALLKSASRHKTVGGLLFLCSAVSLYQFIKLS